MSGVSVIIPCYNRAGLIGPAIESALGQSHPDLEVIVVDDGSTDASWEAIQAFGVRVRGIKVANGGVSRARNIGLAKATGTLVKFLDSDDMLEPEAIARQIRDLDGLPARSIAVGTCRCVDGDGRPLDWDKYRMPCPADGSMMPLATLLLKAVAAWLPLFPIAVLREVGGFREELRIAEDHDLVLRLCHAGYRFFLFPTPTVLIREHSGDRLTRGTETAAFQGVEAAYRDHIAAFAAGPGGPLDAAERAALAQRLWLLARVAAKQGAINHARGLFALAAETGGRQAWVASRPLKLLYHIADPVIAEHIAGIGRRVLNRP